MHLAQNTFIVTGGSSGLGAGTVRRLHAQGANVLIADVNVASGEALAAELGERARFLRTDVTSEEHAAAAISGALAAFGAVQGLVNCAGIAIGAKTLSSRGNHKLSDFSRVIHINLIGTFNMIVQAADAMVKNEPNADGERGVIINTASVAAFDGQIGQAAYSASKGGIVGMTLPVARDLASYGIRVVTVAPGIFDTAMLGGMPDKVRESLAAQVPFPSRLGTPDDYAQLAQHVIENPMLNGETIRLDGAIRLAPR